MTKNQVNKSNFWWYVVASIVIIIIIGVISYAVTQNTSPTISPTPIPTSTPFPSASPSSSPSTSPVASATPAPSGTGTSLTLYAGLVTSGSGNYGYGNSANNIVSPGPTLNLQMGTTYTMTVNNADSIPHSWEITSTKAISATPLFSAGIGVTSYIDPGSSGTVTFTPDQKGNFYYVCTVPFHISLGMWGNVVIS